MCASSSRRSNGTKSVTTSTSPSTETNDIDANLTVYITYPYFWGRQCTWIDKLTINDPDPVFDEFLKAGFARVVVPARPNFEGAIDQYVFFSCLLFNGGTDKEFF